MKKYWVILLVFYVIIQITTQAQMMTKVETVPTIEFATSILNFGAIGDGKTLNTQFIQNAINTVSGQGGGVVLIPAGRFLTGTIVLKNGVFLYLSPGSVLISSTNIEDFPEMIPEYRSYTDNYSQRSLIFAEKQKNIGIVGYGKIYGQGEQFKEDENRIYKFRPYLVRFVECKDVNLEGITFENGAMWTIHLLANENVHCSNIKINSRCNRNNDGIDIDSCENVIVSDCHIVSGDDSIVLKSTSPKPCKNITITNCILSSLCNALKMGTESNGGFQNISISNCTIYDTRISGVTIQTVDGGTTENIVVNNISMKNVSNPIFIRLGNRVRPCCPEKPVTSVGTMKKIILTNIIATGADSIGCPISGLPSHYIEEITFRDINLSFQGEVENQIDIPEEKEDAYPEYRMFGTLPAYGFFIRHVKNIIMENITIHKDDKDIRPSLFLTDVQTPIISNIYIFDNNKKEKHIFSENTSNITLKDIYLNGKVK
ncbi:MAG: glycoside hydrolase family 28 protein [Candidatus Hydrogenedens sp.]